MPTLDHNTKNVYITKLCVLYSSEVDTCIIFTYKKGSGKFNKVKAIS